MIGKHENREAAVARRGRRIVITILALTWLFALLGFVDLVALVIFLLAFIVVGAMFAWEWGLTHEERDEADVRSFLDLL